MLLLVVVLNIIDCGLVLGELVLDLHHVKDILSHSQKTSSVFLQRLQANYPDNVAYTDINDLRTIYEQILRAKIEWDVVDDADSSTVFPYTNTSVTQATLNKTRDGKDQNDSLISDTSQSHRRVKRSAGDSSSCDFPVSVSGLSRSVSVEERVANGLHKTSLFIVCVLIVETILKMFCFGKHFFEHKLEVFDAFIVLISFVVDLIFLEGLSTYSLQDFVYILAFILPWGVIRVVNSLVVVVRDHEHFRLKLLYTQKKKVDSDNKHLRQEKEKLSDQVDSLRRLCLGEGVDDFRIQQSMARSSARPGKGIMGSFASLAMGAIGGGKSNGTSFWNLLNTPKLKRGKSEEWEGKLGVSKMDSQSMRFNERLWTVSGSADMKKPRKSQSLTQQGTTESDPGTPPTIRGRLKALKRLLKRQETVDSYSSTETIDKNSRFSLDRLSSSENITPLHSVDIESVTDMETGDEAPGRISLSPYDVINECIEDKIEENSSMGCIGSRYTAQRPSSPTNIIVTTCSTDDCDSLNFSTAGSKDSVKSRTSGRRTSGGRTSGGRTMEIAVDIEYSDSEVVPMLLQEQDVLSTVPVLSHPSPPSDHKLTLNPETDVIHESNCTHVQHLTNLDCRHHSHSYNCIPSTTQHKNCDISHSNDVDNKGPRKSSMPSNSTIGESGLPSGIAKQSCPVKTCLFAQNKPLSIENILHPTAPQHFLSPTNDCHYTKDGQPLNSQQPSKTRHLLDTAVPVDKITLPNILQQNYATNEPGNTLFIAPDTSKKCLANANPVSDCSTVSGTGNSANRISSSPPARSASQNSNIAVTSSTNRPPSKNNRTPSPSNRKKSLSDKTPSQNNKTPSPINKTPSPNNRTPSPNNRKISLSDKTSSPNNRTPSPINKTTSPNNRTPSPNNRTPSPINKTPSPNNRTPSPNSRKISLHDKMPSPNNRTPSPNNRKMSLHDKTPSPNNRTPSRSPSMHRSPSPSGFVSIHSSNSDISCSFQPIQIPETHLNTPCIPVTEEPHTNSNIRENLTRETPTNSDVEEKYSGNSAHTPERLSDNSGHRQLESTDTPRQGHQNSSDNPTPKEDRLGPIPDMVHTNFPSKEALQNKNNSYHYPMAKSLRAHQEYNSPNQPGLLDTIEKRITDISHLEQSTSSLPSDLAPQRRSSMH
ncbi:mucin-2-like [Ylistrum balloti]|uniref:mucin-2-like n=1 Tax=Ylistrum balloti TaxID=509963 RepID=UPI002905AB61|nr:mucin-2-like [Ylistrum balloti]